MPLDDLRAFYRTGEEIELGRCRSGPLGWSPAAPTGAAVPKQRWTTDGRFGRPRRLAPTRSRLSRRRGPAGRGADDRRRSRRGTAGARLRHLVRGRARARRARVAAGPALHGRPDLRLDGELRRAPRPTGVAGGTLGPARLFRGAAFSGRPGSGRRALSPTPMPPSTPWTCPSPPPIPTCSCTATTAPPSACSTIIELANPANLEWQRHFAAGLRVGGRRHRLRRLPHRHVRLPTGGVTTARAQIIDMRRAYESFLPYFRSRAPRRPGQLQPGERGALGARAGAGPGFRYCEVWPPNAGWRHLEGLMDRSAGQAGRLGPWSKRRRRCGGRSPATRPCGAAGSAEAALRTVVLTEAVATCLGASALIYGDRTAALCDPYYPKHERLSADEAATVIAWHRFALRCRDLFIEGEDTSWYEVDDENGAVAARLGAARCGRSRSAGRSSPGSSVRGGCVAVGVVDLSGSSHGRWSELTGARHVPVRASTSRWCPRPSAGPRLPPCSGCAGTASCPCLPRWCRTVKAGLSRSSCPSVRLVGAPAAQATTIKGRWRLKRWLTHPAVFS